MRKLVPYAGHEGPRREPEPAQGPEMSRALETGLKLKKIMLKKGITRCRCACPRCGGTIHAVLAGRKNHLHMACDGRCGMNIME
jgi:hypothetical protein